jgi:hypothetical protein
MIRLSVAVSGAGSLCYLAIAMALGIDPAGSGGK